MNKETFGAFIAQTRQEIGLTQKNLAEQLHVTDKAVSKWERGLCYPDLTLMENLASALGLTMAELMSCQHEPKESVPSEDQTLAVKSALDISSDFIKRQRTRLRVWAGIAALLVLLSAGIFFLAVMTTQQEQTHVVSKQSDGVEHYIYIHAYHKNQTHLLRLRCPNQETYDAIETGSAVYNLRFRWNRVTYQGTLLEHQKHESTQSIGDVMDQVGSSAGVDSLFGYNCVWQEYVNISLHPKQEHTYLYTFRYYYRGDGSEYFLSDDVSETDLITIKNCLAVTQYDYDEDGIVELFVLTQYEEEPYMLCDTEGGQITSRYVENVPDDVLALFQNNTVEGAA